MRKKILLPILSLLFIFNFSFGTSAVEINPFLIDENSYNAGITFSGNTAYCTVNIFGADGTTKIDSCTVTLKESGGNQVYQWTNQSATGTTLKFSKSTTGVSSGKKYVLSFSATVHRNGKTENISGSTTKTYN